MSGTLKPCPFCAQSVVLLRAYFPRPHDKRGDGYMVHCQACDARVVADVKELAVIKWNRREGVVESTE